MTWVKLEDTFPQHPAVVTVGPAAAWSYVEAVFESARLRSDGYIYRDDDRTTNQLVSAGLLTPGRRRGYQITLLRPVDFMFPWIEFGVPDVSGQPLAAIRGSWTPEPREGVRPKLPQHIRDRVMWRDRGRCVVCGKTDSLHIDHIYPWSRGGAFSDESNLQVLCMWCNTSKGARTMEEWLG